MTRQHRACQDRGATQATPTHLHSYTVECLSCSTGMCAVQQQQRGDVHNSCATTASASATTHTGRPCASTGIGFGLVQMGAQSRPMFN